LSVSGCGLFQDGSPTHGVRHQEDPSLGRAGIRSLCLGQDSSQWADRLSDGAPADVPRELREQRPAGIRVRRRVDQPELIFLPGLETGCGDLQRSITPTEFTATVARASLLPSDGGTIVR
jgi:hypothetical protein